MTQGLPASPQERESHPHQWLKVNRYLMYALVTVLYPPPTASTWIGAEVVCSVQACEGLGLGHGSKQKLVLKSTTGDSG